MTIFDAAMAIVVVAGMIRGAWRGITWQLASIGSLVLGYLTAYPVSAQIAPYLPGPPETTRALSMAAAYAVVAGSVFGVAWLVRATLHKLKFEAFDRHLGMILGGLEGAGVGILLTALVVSLAPATREPIFTSPTGRVVGKVMDNLGPILPVEVRQVLSPFWNDGGVKEALTAASERPSLASEHDAAAGSPSDPAPRPSDIVSKLPRIEAAPVIDTHIRRAESTQSTVESLPPPLEPAEDPAPVSSSSSREGSPLDTLIERGKKEVERAVIESIDPEADASKKAASFRQLYDREKKRVQEAVTGTVGRNRQKVEGELQGRLDEGQKKLQRTVQGSIKRGGKLEKAIDDTIDRGLRELGGLESAPQKGPR